MPPFKHSAKEEDDFMNSLLSELDAKLPSAAPPLSIPARRNETSTSVLHHVTPPVSGRRTESKKTRESHNANLSTTSCNATQQVFQAHDVDIGALLDGAEEWDWDDIMSDAGSPKKIASPKRIATQPELPTYVAQPCTRCIVKKVEEQFDVGRFHKILAVETVTGHESRCVILDDNWTETDLQVGDIVNIIGSFSTSNASTSLAAPVPTITVNAKSNLLIVHPDILITATALSNASQCLRKPIVAGLIRAASDMTSLVWGNMLHEVMQTCLNTGRWDDSWIDDQIAETVERDVGDVMRLGLTVDQAKIEVKARAKGLKAFSEKYIAQEPKPEAILTNTRTAHAQTSLLAIAQLHDIEEDIWSPTYGLKGKLDASVRAVITETDSSSSPFSRAAPKKTSQSWTMPLEIKTGRAIAGMEHRAQTMLYTLLMEERYATEVPSGLLYYTQNEEVVRVPAARNEVRALLMVRNEIAGYMMKRMRGTKHSKQDAVSSEMERFLPPTINDARTCGKCFTLDTCMLYRKAVEGVVDETSPIADIYALKTAHLTPAQCEFFKKWENLISLEEQDLLRFRKEIWTMGAAEREERGRCFSNMVLDSAYRLDAASQMPQKGSKIHKYTYKFLKAGIPLTQASLLNGHMSCGDAITVSVEPDLLAWARGFIVDLTPTVVVVGVDHNIDCETIRGRLGRKQTEPEGEIIFRIDKDELSAGMGRIRDNLAQLFYRDGDSRRLKLVVDLESPHFDDSDEDMSQDSLSTSISHLNQRQRAAVRKVLSAEDYALILGMPGTGKTTVIAEIIRQLVEHGKTVLLVSYTHSAVDTVLLKLKQDADFGILRLGNIDKIHPEVHDLTLSARRAATSVEQLEHQVMTPPVVATTCLSIDHPLFSRRKFDYCIVDEASQITLPTCLGPLRFADKFVLVGDHFQLPPLVRNMEARKGGLDVSLFRLLTEAHPHAVIDLTEQYRMNADIMLLSNKLIYSDKLRCGSDAVASKRLILPNPAYLERMHITGPCYGGECWMRQLLDNSRSAVFVDTDAIPALESRVGDLVENQIEARLVYQVAEALIGSGIRQDQIGVISLYRQQLKHLSLLLQDRKEIEMLTADRSQGRDKDCILISFVRSNDTNQIGDLMKDWRRMNVAFTRARSKLIMFGSRKTLQTVPLLGEFFDLMEAHNWILKLPPNAHQLHERTSTKRPAEDGVIDIFSPELKESVASRKKGKRSIGQEGLVKGRPILRDLINSTK